jgi:hypothetical protein
MTEHPNPSPPLLVGGGSSSRDHAPADCAVTSGQTETSEQLLRAFAQAYLAFWDRQPGAPETGVQLARLARAAIAKAEDKPLVTAQVDGDSSRDDHIEEWLRVCDDADADQAFDASQMGDAERTDLWDSPEVSIPSGVLRDLLSSLKAARARVEELERENAKLRRLMFTPTGDA